jgi:hypothetical protein
MRYLPSYYSMLFPHMLSFDTRVAVADGRDTRKLELDCTLGI